MQVLKEGRKYSFYSLLTLSLLLEEYRRKQNSAKQHHQYQYGLRMMLKNFSIAEGLANCGPRWPYLASGNISLQPETLFR
jgi:hypothetical protein